MTIMFVSGCKGCPLRRDHVAPSVPITLWHRCVHPDNETGERVIEGPIAMDGGAPDWCPLVGEPFQVQRK